MTEQEKKYFESLRKDREESDKILQKPSMQGVKKSVVEKYSDQAHFIYELLQNADDAGATETNFELYKDKLIFRHNGTRHFSVSDPSTENADTARGLLGDINAITSIANSNKTSAEIGKFGVGFKSVFQYTSTPYIYDDKFRFYIDNFIVPVAINNDLPDRKTGETVFVFPFNHKEKTAEQAYFDIADKLKKLKLPILFLTNLNFVYYKINENPDGYGLYGKGVEESFCSNGVTVELIKLTHNIGDDFEDTRLWLFSRRFNNLRYSVGFFTDVNGKLVPVTEYAFCYFPTKEVTGLKFIVHAPFLLTDSREGIKAAEKHNKDMISLLATLAAESLVLLKDIGIKRNIRLIDDNIFDILPYDEKNFTALNNNDKISFMLFFTAIKEKLATEELLPASGGYTDKRNAYWAAVTKLPELFSDSQLAQLSHNPDAKWVFTSLGRDNALRRNENSPLSSYIDSITRMWLDESSLLKGRTTGNRAIGFRKIFDGIDKNFIENQPIEWLHTFYKWIAERTQRTEAIKQLPVFLDQNGKAVAAYKSDGSLNLFFDVEGNNVYTTINSALMKNEDTVKFLKTLGIKAPSLKDEIISIILPQYSNSNAEVDVIAHFKKIFEYYKKCPQSEIDGFIAKIKDTEFLLCNSKEDAALKRKKARDIYISNTELETYFSAKPSTYFIALNEYEILINENESETLYKFLKRLGVNTEVKLQIRYLDMSEVYKYKIYIPNSTHQLIYKENYLDGFDDIIFEITENQDVDKSVCLWNTLLKLCKNNNFSLSCIDKGKCLYFYYSQREQSYESTFKKKLLTFEWLINSENKFVSAKDIYIEDLDAHYNTEAYEAKILISYLNIKEKPLATIQEELSEEERRHIEIDNLLKENNINSLQELSEILNEHIKRQKSEKPQIQNDGYSDDAKISETQQADTAESDAIEKVIRKIRKIPIPANPVPTKPKDNFDEDDYTKPSVDYTKKIEQAEEKSRIEIEKIAHLQELHSATETAEKYSYLWFKTLLELESLANNEDDGNNREISISFAKVELEPCTSRTLILKHPNRYIPQFMEDLADIPLTLRYGDQTKKVAIEVINVKSYSLKVKLKSGADIQGIDLSTVNEAKIEAQNPAFLLKELISGINSLGFTDDYNLQYNLPENIEFIFGPPGTGKTTYLAQNVILPLTRARNDLKILVLTPTNKAADVITKRIMEYGSRDNYTDWLIRFGTSNDEEIERSGVYKDKTFDIRSMRKNVTITTIARFPYDFFMPEDTRLHLSELKWNYIIIDEASMIHIANIIYPLYKKTPIKFIIAGDPFQIQPISRCEEWKDENIYTMVKLESFTRPTTTPHDYKVELLTTQYRSVPSIGNVYSNFAYGGVLKHNRTEQSRRNLNISEFIELHSLNIIKFPVSRYESIFKPKRLLGKTPYQIYSALFTFELVKYIAEKLEAKNGDETFSLGIIAPYRAQADLIDKLITSYKCPRGIDIQVGTIHGFQGDECDIVFSVFNPPPQITASKEMFLNKKNIINVSISRARDYLVVVMPDDNTENIENLRLVNNVKNLCIINKCVQYNSLDLEKLIFNDDHYLENNSFATSHQVVNVYGKPELKYEIRSEDTAVDIQIHADQDD